MSHSETIHCPPHEFLQLKDEALDSAKGDGLSIQAMAEGCETLSPWLAVWVVQDGTHCLTTLTREQAQSTRDWLDAFLKRTQT